MIKRIFNSALLKKRIYRILSVGDPMMETRPRNGVITKYNKPFIEQRADPYVYRHTDGNYYFTA